MGEKGRAETEAVLTKIDKALVEYFKLYPPEPEKVVEQP